ncbi:MAG: hypothetical protein DMF73_05185 [Acidobacteria bacterium]|nr:MAG: hypothetical protein DMF73_05185 [Acidobacteriota bacterium]
MGALAPVALELLAPEVLAAGLLVVAGLLLAVLDGVFSALLPQDITVAARATARTNTGDFIDCLLMILTGLFCHRCRLPYLSGSDLCRVASFLWITPRYEIWKDDSVTNSKNPRICKTSVRMSISI